MNCVILTYAMAAAINLGNGSCVISQQVYVRVDDVHVAIVTKRFYCNKNNVIKVIYSRLSRSNTARGSSTGLSLVGPTKVKARKSFLFTWRF